MKRFATYCRLKGVTTKHVRRVRHLLGLVGLVLASNLAIHLSWFTFGALAARFGFDAEAIGEDLAGLSHSLFGLPIVLVTLVLLNQLEDFVRHEHTTEKEGKS